MQYHVNGDPILFTSTQAPKLWKFWIDSKTPGTKMYQRQSFLAPKSISSEMSASKLLGAKKFGVKMYQSPHLFHIEHLDFHTYWPHKYISIIDFHTSQELYIDHNTGFWINKQKNFASTYTRWTIHTEIFWTSCNEHLNIFTVLPLKQRLI